MKKLFFAMLALVALASCSKDEVVQLNQDEIKYSVVAENATKAADVYCNNNLMESFNVWAYVAESADAQTTVYKNFIAGDVVSKNGTGDDTKWETTNTRFWPDGEVSFFAHVNAGSYFTWPTSITVNSVPTIKDFVVDETVSEQVDLLYAVAKETKSSSNTTANLNFRHALSQIVFYAKNNHPNIHVDIEKIKVFNVNGKNTFTYPSEPTATNWDTHDQTTDTWSAQGSWATTDVTSTYSDYEVAVPADENTNYTEVPYKAVNETAVNLTDNAEDHATENTFKRSMLLLPQTTTAYASDNKNGSYIILYCKIYNVLDVTSSTDADDVTTYTSSVNRETDVVLESKGVAVPMAFTWEQGKKYVYTFVFGAKTNGGYEIGDGEEDVPTDDEVLVNVNYEVTVDDFLNGTSSDVKLEPQESTGAGA